MNSQILNTLFVMLTDFCSIIIIEAFVDFPTYIVDDILFKISQILIKPRVKLVLECGVEC